MFTFSCHVETGKYFKTYIYNYSASDNTKIMPTVDCTRDNNTQLVIPSSSAQAVFGITCTATDAAKRSNSCSWTVTVKDLEAPKFVLSCGSNIALETITGSNRNTFVAPEVIDNGPLTTSVICKCC